MRKRARSVLAGLLILCCTVASLLPALHVRAGSSVSAGHVVTVSENADPAHAAYPVLVSLGAGSTRADDVAEAVPATESPSSGPWQTAWVWAQRTAQSVGSYVGSLSMSIRDFFVSGRALKTLQTATQAIDDFAVRLFLPLSTLVVPILERLVPGLSVTPELVAIWTFWIVVILVLLVLILALRPRHGARKRLPKPSPRIPGQGENSIEFGLVEQGPKPSPTASLEQLARTREAQESPPAPEPAVQPTIAKESPRPGPDSPSIPAEIVLEPLGFFDSGETAPATPAEVPEDAIVDTPSAAPPLLEFASSDTHPPVTEPDLSESLVSTETAPAEVPAEALLASPQESASDQEPPVGSETKPFPEPELRPIGQEAPIQAVEPEGDTTETVSPLAQPLPPEETPADHQPIQAMESAVSEAPVTSQTTPVEGSDTVQEATAQPAEEVPVANEPVPPEQATPETAPVETVSPEVEPLAVEPAESVSESSEATLPESGLSASSGADLLSQLLDDEESFQQTVVAAGTTVDAGTPEPAAVPIPSASPAPQPAVFAGDVELDALLHDGVVTDAGALTQLFRGGYRNRIAKLAVSAKDLQNVPEEMRHVIKLTVVALSPIELSIARDLAMRLEAPGFVGEALLVAKKMGYENYLTTYKKISKNYKDVSIVETASLKTPETLLAEPGDDLISFS